MTNYESYLAKQLEAARHGLICDSEVIGQLKSLIRRAADALEKYTNYPIGMVMSVTLRESGRSVLAELRKATK